VEGKVRLAVSIMICQAAGFIGSFFTVSSVQTWYTTLQKPAFNPPSWVFAPVWTILYILIGIALFLVWSAYDKASKKQEKYKIKIALGVFGLQLFLNTLWSILFFGMRNPGLALVGILVLWLLILLTIIRFYEISKKASFILLPYIIWVSYAALLNWSIYKLN
jgi:translocator protein